MLVVNLFLLVIRNFIPFDSLFALNSLLILGLSFLFDGKLMSRNTIAAIIASVTGLLFSIVQKGDVQLILIGFLSVFCFLVIYLNCENHIKISPQISDAFCWIFIVSVFVQFFISKNLWGFLADNNYSNELEHVTERAISLFTTSPQSTGVVSGLLLLREVQNEHGRKKVLKIFFLVLCGLLTFSKIFVIFAAAVVLIKWKYIIRPKYIIPIGLVTMIVFFFVVDLSQITEGIGRLTTIAEAVTNPSGYNTFSVWQMQFDLNRGSLIHLLFGVGLGQLSRSNINIADVLGHTSSESYTLQVYNEIGIIGLALVLYALLRDRSQRIRAMVWALFAASLFNPVMYGITSSFVIFFNLLPIQKDEV